MDTVLLRFKLVGGWPSLTTILIILVPVDLIARVLGIFVRFARTKAAPLTLQLAVALGVQLPTYELSATAPSTERDHRPADTFGLRGVDISKSETLAEPKLLSRNHNRE